METISRTTVYPENAVPAGFVLDMTIIDLSFLDHIENVETLQQILQDPAKVEVVNELILWRGRLNAGGYPVIRTSAFPVTGNVAPRDVLLHRVVYELLVDHAPTNAFICHRSNIRRSVSPGDLFQGTPADNNFHKTICNRGNYKFGEDHHCAKLKNEDIAQMIHLRYANVMRVKDIAEMFNITPSHCSRITCARIWKHITENLLRAELTVRAMTRR